MKHIGKQEYAELIAANRQIFYRIAYSYVKNEQEALDIVSEATYRGLVHIRDLREPAYFKTWMTRIMINTALETVRKNSRQVVLKETMSEDCDIEKLEQEIQIDLYTALDALGAEDKSFIILKYFEGYSFKDISKRDWNILSLSFLQLWTCPRYDDKIITKIEEHLPEVEIYLMAYYPVNYEAATEDMKECLKVRTNSKISHANTEVERMAQRHGQRYIDVNRNLKDEQGRLKAEYTIEGLHINDTGYRAIYNDLMSYVKEPKWRKCPE